MTESGRGDSIDILYRCPGIPFICSLHQVNPSNSTTISSFTMVDYHLAYFTVTQAFLGAPLTFDPVLGSEHLNHLIHHYVPGPASRQDKLSQITMEFYHHACVDLTNGALVKTYTVLLPSPPSSSCSASPTQPSASASPASSFGVSVGVPTPSSSASDSFSEQLPGPFDLVSSTGSLISSSTLSSQGHRTRSNRVAKPKRKPDARKALEMSLPGFQIMTADGVDITYDPGRTTKTREQREHAHLMRQLRACDACRRKKIKVRQCGRSWRQDLANEHSAIRLIVSHCSRLQMSLVRQVRWRLSRLKNSTKTCCSILHDLHKHLD